MRKLIGIVIILILLGIGYLGYVYIKDSAEYDSHSSDTKVSLQLLPFPLIIANDGSKNDSLLELLLNKDKKTISIHNGNLEFVDVVPFGSKVFFEGVSLHFAYDHQENKVKFSGNIRNKINTAVSGEYYLNDKNNVVYNLKFDSDLYNILISGNYKFLEDQAGILEGSFSCNFPNIAKFFEIITDNVAFNSKNVETLAFNGDYTYQDNKLTINNAVIKSNNIDMLFGLDFNNDSTPTPTLTIDAGINHLDFDKIIDPSTSGEALKVIKINFATMIQNMLSQYNSDNVFQAKISGSEIILNGIDIKNFLLEVKSQANNFLVNKLSFSLPGDSNIAASGNISSNKYRPIFTGKASVASKDLKQLTSYIDNNLGVIQLQNNISMSATAQIIVTPILTSLYNINFTGGDGLITGDWFYSNYDLQKIVHSDFSFSNFNIDKKSIINTQILSNLVKKSNQEDFVKQLMKLKSVEVTHDSDLQFNNVSVDSTVLNQLNCEAVLRPNFVELNGIKIKSDLMKFSGDMSIDVSGVKPVIQVDLKGDLFDSNFLKYLSSYTKAKDSDSVQPVNLAAERDRKFEIFRFDKFTGYIQLNFAKITNDLFEANNFNFLASIKDGIIKIEKFNANAFNGYLQFLGNISLAPLKANFSYSLTDADVNQLIYSISKNSNFSGNTNIIGNFNSSGDSINELTTKLNGEIKMQSNSLLIDNFNISSLVALYGKSPKSSVGKKTDIRSGNTLFNTASGDIVIKSGVFISDKLSFETDNNISGATGFNFQLSKNILNSITSIAYVDPEGNIDGFNVSLNGPLSNLKLQLGSGSKPS
jgi:hypothetical protein